MSVKIKPCYFPRYSGASCRAVYRCKRNTCEYAKKHKVTWKNCPYGGKAGPLLTYEPKGMKVRIKPKPEKKRKQILIQAWEREKNPGMNPPGTYFVIKKIDALRCDQLPQEYCNKSPFVCKVLRKTKDGKRISVLGLHDDRQGMYIAPGDILHKEQIPGLLNFCRRAGNRLRGINQRKKKEQQKGKLRTWRI